MPYPEIRLTRHIRRAIMAVLIASFFIITPLVILYTEGYRYHWRDRRLEKTGVISISATPADAAVSVNNVRLKKRLPLRLPNRAPGSYRIEIRQEGYKPWIKDISVESRQSTYIKDITLLKEALPVITLPDTGESRIVSARLSPSGKTLLVVRHDRETWSATLANMQTRSETAIFRRAGKRQPTIEWSPLRDTALIAIATEFMLVNGETSDISPPLSIPGGIESARWQWGRGGLESLLYVSSGKTIFKLAADRPAESFASTPAPDRPWFVDANERLWTIDESGRRIVSSSTMDLFSSDEAIVSIHDLADRRAIVGTESGIRVVPHPQKSDKPQKIISGARRVRWNPGTKEWLVWSPWELSSVYSDGAVATLNRTSIAMEQVEPLDQNGVVLLAGTDELAAFNPGYYISHYLFRGGKLESVAGVSQKTRAIFFLGAIGRERGVFELNY